MSNFGNVRRTKFKEGRKEAITPPGVFHALAVISIAHFLKTHVCTIYGEKQVRLAHNQPNIPIQVTLGRISTQNMQRKFSPGLSTSTGGPRIQRGLESKP